MSGASLGTAVELGYAPNFTDLRNITTTGLDDGYALYVGGYGAEGDGGGGIFAWNASDTTTDNDGTILQPTAGGTGRWLRQYQPPVDVRWFGAKGDGATDDTSELQAAFDTVESVLIPTGTYITSSALTYHDGQSIMGEGFEKTIVEARHTGDILKPDDTSQNYKAVSLSRFALTKDETNKETGDGLRISNMRSGVFAELSITKCDIGLNFETQEDANYSYFNEFTSLVIVGCATNAVRTAAAGTDYPNRNFWMAGDWRGGDVTLKIAAGGSQTFSGISIQGADTNWAEVDDSGTSFIGCHFENSDALPPGQGVVFNSGGGKVIGGTCSKGNIVAYIDPETLLPNTKVISAGRRYLELTSELLRDGGFGVVSVPWIGEPDDNNYPTTGAGRRQNLFRKSHDQANSSWNKTGTVTVTKETSGGPYDSHRTKLAFDPSAGTTPSIEQVMDGTDGASLAAASALICFSVEIMAEDSGYIRLDIEGDSGAAIERTRTSIPVTTEWRRYWITKQFSASATGNVLVTMTNSNISGNLDTVYTANWQLESGVTRPGVRLVTNGPRATAEWGIYADGMVGDFTSEGIATFVKAGTISDSDFSYPRNGMVAVGQDGSGGYKLWAKCDDGTWRGVLVT